MIESQNIERLEEVGAMAAQQALSLATLLDAVDEALDEVTLEVVRPGVGYALSGADLDFASEDCSQAFRGDEQEPSSAL